MDTVPRPMSSPLSAPTPDQAALLAGFESLGAADGGTFGFVQRVVGLEPDSLLRWAQLDEDTLSLLLETDLDGVGGPGNILVGVRDDVAEGGDEWWTTDPRHVLWIRTFVKTNAESLPAMARRVRRRMVFLRQRLLDDLTAGTRIYVFRQAGVPASRERLDRLGAALRRHGPALLLYVRSADAEHPAGVVRARGDGLLIGAIAPSTASDLTAWIGLCARALEVAVHGGEPEPVPLAAPAVTAAPTSAVLVMADLEQLTQRAAAQLKVEQFADAVKTLRQANALAPDNAAILGQMTVAMLRIGQVDAALPLAHRVVALDRKNPQSHARLAHAQALLGDLESAEASQRQAVALNQKAPGLRLTLSTFLLRQGQNVAALAEAKIALTLQPNNIRSLMQVARSAVACGQLQQAEAALRRAIELEPGNAALVRQLAELQARAQKAVPPGR